VGKKPAGGTTIYKSGSLNDWIRKTEATPRSLR